MPPVLLAARRRVCRSDLTAILGVFTLAAAMRIGLVLVSRGGLGGDRGYDPGVYYAGADALIHGRLPYADFVLLHPPGVLLALAPFAALGVVTTDHAGYLVANAAFELLGAVNAVLVLVAARRYGLGARAALMAGAFYAVWFGAVHPETTIKLEPLGMCAFLLGLIALGGTPTGRRAVLGGLALGFAVTVKIWRVVPVGVVLGWWLLQRGSRRFGLRVVVGVVVALVLVDGPFLLTAPSAMARMVVADQLGRRRGMSTGGRLSWLTSVGNGVPAGIARDGALLAALALGAAVVVLALHVRSTRLINGCRNWVDVSGRTYDVDTPADGRYVRRPHNRRWQHDLRRYLLSGQVAILMRHGTGVGSALRHELAHGGRVVDQDGVKVYVVRQGG